MFVQVIQGRANDPDALEKQWRKWAEQVKPGAEGYLGGTGGVTSDGEFVAVARFESQEAAQRNSDRPEQGQWWSETEQYLDNPTFQDCTEVEEWMGGGSDDAGFVQVIQGPADEDDMNEDEQKTAEVRPDLFGGISAKHPDGKTFTTVAYFKDESSAREGESKPEFQQLMEEAGSTPDRNKYFDLTNPWLDSK